MPLGPRNPHGVGFDVVERVLESEQEAQRNCAPERSRVWKVGPPAQLACLVHTITLPFALRLWGFVAASSRIDRPVLNRPPLWLPVCPAGAEPQRAQPRHRQAGGMEAHARLTEPAPAGTREPPRRLACLPATRPMQQKCCHSLRPTGPANHQPFNPLMCPLASHTSHLSAHLPARPAGHLQPRHPRRLCHQAPVGDSLPPSGDEPRRRLSPAPRPRPEPRHRAVGRQEPEPEWRRLRPLV